jgi:hypothetical protein
MVDQEIQSRVNVYPKWTQTSDQMTTMQSNVYQPENLVTEERVDTRPLSKAKTRGISNKIRKKRSVISKASIKPSGQIHNPPSDLVFSPTDRRQPAKLSSTMKKSNTLTTNPSRLGSSINPPNRFLFRGNEEFHSTTGRQGFEPKSSTNQDNQPLYVTSGSRQKSKHRHNK